MNTTPFRLQARPMDLPALRSVRTPRAARTLSRALAALLVAVALALALAPWQQSASGQGRVVAWSPLDRQQNLEAPIEGRIVRWHVREGSHVRQGDPVVDLSDNDPAILERLRQERSAVVSRVAAARERVVALDERILSLGGSRAAGVEGAGQRVRMADQRVRAAEQTVSASEAVRDTARANAQRQRGLNTQGLSSERTRELADLDLARAEADVDRARAALLSARSEALALRADLDRVGNDVSAALQDARASRASALAEVASGEATLAQLEVRLARQQAQSVTAPRSGTILRLVAAQGTEMVKAGDALAVLVPDTEERAVELWVDGNDIPLLAVGRHARLQFEGWPAVQFTGWPSVAVGTFGGRVALIDATDNGRGKFRVLVVPDRGERWPSSRYLRQGVRVNGWVLLGRVSLGYELWRQFNGFPPVVALDEPGASGGSPSGGGK